MNKNIVFRAIMLLVTLQAVFVTQSYGAGRSQSPTKPRSQSDADKADKQEQYKVKRRTHKVAPMPGAGAGAASNLLASPTSGPSGQSSPGKGRRATPTSGLGSGKPSKTENKIPVDHNNLPVAGQLDYYCEPPYLHSKLQTLFINNKEDVFNWRQVQAKIDEISREYGTETKQITINRLTCLTILQSHMITYLRNKLPSDQKPGAMALAISLSSQSSPGSPTQESADSKSDSAVTHDAGKEDGKTVALLTDLELSNKKLREEIAQLQKEMSDSKDLDGKIKDLTEKNNKLASDLVQAKIDLALAKSECNCVCPAVCSGCVVS